MKIKSAAIAEWAAKQDWNQGFQHVASQSGKGYQTVYAIARRLGIKEVKLMKRGRKFGTHRKIADYSSIDWSRRDAHLAVDYGVSRERIRQIRLEHGVPRNSATLATTTTTSMGRR